MKSNPLHRIVIVGGGVGGLELAVRLGRLSGRDRTHVPLLIDQGLTHLWKPLLHEVAAGTLDAGYEADDYLVLARRNGFHFRPGTMTGLSRKYKTIQLDEVIDSDGVMVLPATDISYDTLVLALGSESNDFGIPGVKEHCLFIDNQRQANHLQSLLISRLLSLQYRCQRESTSLPKLQVAIVGAGATGVELAAELHNVAKKIKGFGFDSLDEVKPIHITLIEAAPRILPALSERVSLAAQRQLEKRGVQILTNLKVQKITEETVQVAEGGAIHADLKVWAAGIKAPDFLSRLDGLEVNPINQLNVRQDLRSTLDANIFAMGDCAHCPQPARGQSSVPPRAQAAHQQAALLAKNLVRRLNGQTMENYVYRDHGSLISLSQSFIGNLMGNLIGTRFVEGYVARWVYLSLYRSHQIVLHGTFRTILMMIVDRLRRRFKPRLKLH